MTVWICAVLLREVNNNGKVELTQAISVRSGVSENEIIGIATKYAKKSAPNSQQLLHTTLSLEIPNEDEKE